MSKTDKELAVELMAAFINSGKLDLTEKNFDYEKVLLYLDGFYGAVKRMKDD